MKKKFRIAVVGIGGVGGYYGSRLAKRYAGSDTHEIIFIARGEHKTRIEEEGLTLLFNETAEVTHPDLINDDLAALGKLDLVLFCVKSYSLQQVASEIKESIDQNTYILPLLNGVESIEYLSGYFAEAKLLWGCTYIISSITSPGVVEVQGKYNRLVWGNPELPPDDLSRIKKVFDEAGIHNELYDDIQNKVWEKFSFISPLASFTSHTNHPAGNILQSQELQDQLQVLISELKEVATVKGIQLPEDIVERNIRMMEKFPKETTSSMHRDYQNNNPTELENLTGYIVWEGGRTGVATPAYQKIYTALKKK